MNKWVLPPNEVTFDLQIGNSSNPLINPPPVPYHVSNAVHGGEGELLFYIVDNQIYDSDGINVGQLNNAIAPNGNTYFSGSNPLSEIVLFPVPNRCNQYCAVTLNYESYGSALAMTEISIDDNGDVIVTPFINGGLDFFLLPDDGGLALTKPLAGTFADRFLYVVKDYQLIRYTISDGGIGSKVILNNNIPVESTLSLELSYDETFLSYGNWLGSQIYTIDLTDPTFPVKTYDVVASSELPILGVFDVEIDKSGKFIYFSSDGTASTPAEDIYQLNLDNGNVAALNAQFKVSKTQLELAKDGLIYFVNEDDQLCFINPDLSMPIPTISPLDILVESDIELDLGFSFHTLPDQIDGQNYNEFEGTEDINITELTLGGFELPQTYPSGGVGLPELFNCGSIPFDHTFTGEPIDITFEIYSTNSVNGTPINTNCNSPNPDLVCFYKSGLLSSFPNFFSDLRCGDNPIACDLFTGSIAAGNTTFRLKITYSNRCETVSKIGHFKVGDIPTSPITVLGINAGNGSTTCSASQNINSPCAGGTFSANIDLSSSTGGITFYELTVSEVDCGTGNTVQVLFPTTPFAINNPGTIGLNSLEIQGSTGFFANNSSNWLGRCLKIEATVGNNCGSTTEFSYLRFDGEYYTAGNDNAFTKLDDNSFKEEKNTTKDNQINHSSSFFPNPFTDQINFDLNLEEDVYASLLILDNQGQSRKLLEQDLTKGNHTMQLDFSQYPPGIYYYQLNLGDTVKTGKLIKVQ